MKKIGIVLLALIVVAAVVSLIALNANATLSAGPNQTVKIGQTVMFNGTTTDNVSAIVQVTWNFGDNTTAVNGTSPALLNSTHIYTAVGVYNANLTVKFDSTLNKTDTASTTITVVQNLPPIANAGPDQFVEQTNPLGANVTLNGSNSSDPNNDTLTYNWTWTNGTATGVNATAFLPPGNTTVTLFVSDGQLNATDTVNIVVRDTTPPAVNINPNTVTAAPGTPVTLNGTATDAVSTRFNFTWSENGAVIKTQANATSTNLNNTFTSGTHIVSLNATDQAGNTGTATATIVTADTIPPTVTINPQNSTIEAGTAVTLNGTATDNISVRFNFTWSENGVVLKTQTNATSTTLTSTFSLGTHVLSLNATDEAGNTGSATAKVMVIDTTPPVVSISPQSITVEAGTPVTLDGTATDAVSTLFSFTWSEGSVVLKSQANAPSTSLIYDTEFKVGTHTIALKATDEAGNTGSAIVTVKVVDTTAPTIQATVAPSSLSPPNHQYIEVKTDVTVSDLGDPAPKITLVSVTSNEPDNGKGDGNTVNDIVIVDNFTFNVRAERSGAGSGRTYTIIYKATDVSGNSATASVTIEVPHK